MLNTILGTKIKMSQSFVDGARVPVTLVKAGPCVVTQIKKEGKDGYWAVQLGFGEKKIKNVTKPMKRHLKGAISKSKLAPRFLREVRLKEEPKLNVGDQVKVSNIFAQGDIVAVTGISKGKGFAGVVKRWGFKGGPRTHGQSDRPRSPGSIGQGTTPGRVWKGKKMAGRMGSETVTVKNLKAVLIDGEKNEMLISGPIPGRPKGLLIIKKLKEAEKKAKLEKQAKPAEKIKEKKADKETVKEKEEGKESPPVETKKGKEGEKHG